MVRLRGIGFCLPHTECRPDETNVVYTAFRFTSGDLNPHFFDYPTLFMYVLVGVYAAYFAAGWMAGQFQNGGDLAAQFGVDPSAFYLMARMVSAVFGTLTILAVYAIGRRWFGRATGLVAAALLSVTFLHARESHFGTTDIAMTWWIVVAVYWITRAYEAGRVRDYAIAGLCAGLAIGTKYTALTVAVPMVIGHVLQARGDPRQMFDRRLFAFAAAAAAAFLATTPFAVLDAPRFLNDMDRMWKLVSAREPGVAVGSGWLYHLRVWLFYGLGWPLLAAALAGVALTIRRYRALGWILLGFPLAHYAAAGASKFVLARYILPVVPFLCVTAAVSLVSLVNALPLRDRIWRAAVLTLVTVAAVSVSAQRLWDFDLLLTRPDSRLLMKAWFREHVPDGSIVYQSGSAYGHVQFEPRLEDLEELAARELAHGYSTRETQARLHQGRGRGLVGYRLTQYEPSTDQFVMEHSRDHEAVTPDYIIVGESPLRVFSGVPDAVLKRIAVDYELRHTVEGVSFRHSDRVFDQQDGFFVPFADFRQVERPGPTLRVYGRIIRK